jgi:hypothetical protein
VFQSIEQGDVAFLTEVLKLASRLPETLASDVPYQGCPFLKSVHVSQSPTEIEFKLFLSQNNVFDGKWSDIIETDGVPEIVHRVDIPRLTKIRRTPVVNLPTFNEELVGVRSNDYVAKANAYAVDVFHDFAFQSLKTMISSPVIRRMISAFSSASSFVS